MKTLNLLFGVTILIIVFSACREITVRTTVNEDGSFTRIVTVSGDSADVYKKDLPYPVNTSWAMTSEKDTANKGKFIVTYTKKFRDCQELQEEINRDTGWMKQLDRRIEISKRFGFFYSYIEYKEVYKAANPFTALSSKSRLTPEEIRWITRQLPVQSPSDSIRSKNAEDKLLAYLVESAATEVEKILADGIAKLNDPHLDAKQVPQFRDSIKTVLSKWQFTNDSELTDSYMRWTGNSAAGRLRELTPPLFSDFNRKARLLENLISMEDFHVETEMPGLITGTNSVVLNGNRVSWDLSPMSFLLEDYTMVVESRVINGWAYLLSGLILLGLISVLIVKTLKGKSHSG